MAVIRPELPQLAFTMIPNAWVRDPRLDPNAFRILSVVLSHSAGYRLSVSQIMRESGIGRDGVNAGMDRLRGLGYMVAVEQARAERGRFGENDYTITSCTDRAPSPPESPDQPHIPGTNVGTGPSRSEPSPAGPSPARPPSKKNRGEEQGENTPPAPPETGGRHLAAVGTPQQQIAAAAQELTREHYDASGGLARYPAVLSIVKRALSAVDESGASRWNAGAVRGALTLLRESGRPVTLETLRAALTTPGAVSRRGYGAPAPYRNPDPTSQPDAFSGSF